MALLSETVDTRFTRLVGCRLPFRLAVPGGAGTTELAAVVSAGGGLGMVPYGVEPPSTGLGPSGIGFLVPYLPPAGVIAEAASRVRVVEFFGGDCPGIPGRALGQSASIALSGRPGATAAAGSRVGDHGSPRPPGGWWRASRARAGSGYWMRYKMPHERGGPGAPLVGDG